MGKPEEMQATKGESRLIVRADKVGVGTEVNDSEHNTGDSNA